MTFTFSLPQLTPDERPWRLDWFGELAYPGMVKQYRHPYIKVAVSPLLGSLDDFGASAEFRTDISQQRDVWVPLGCLPMLRIGDIWQQGAFAKSPPYSLNSFGLKIFPETTTVVKAGLSVEESYLLPFAEHPWHRHHTQSYCLEVKATDDISVIIPGVELIRFYFGSSSKLLHRLVTQPLREEALWREKYYDFDRRHLHLKLADGLSGTSASDIGRIAQEPYAWRAASYIYGHCLRAASMGEVVYPYTYFPFQGLTTIVSHGMWLPVSGSSRCNFLVFRLQHCSHRFPFESLTYEVSDRTLKKRGLGMEGPLKETSAAKRFQSKKSGAMLSSTDPGSAKTPRRIPFDQAYRFSDLKGKSIWREQIVASTVAGVMRVHADGSLEQLAFGEPDGSGKAGAVDACVNGSSPLSIADTTDLPHFVKTGMTMLMSQRRDRGNTVRAKPLLAFGRDECVFALPTIVDEDGVVDTVTLYTEPDGRHRQRRACFIGIFDAENVIERFAIVEGVQVRNPPSVHQIHKFDLIEVLSREIELEN
ncbi:hypothetical protein LZ012_02540 [Dechloromonas sp. XY25]|uniref:Uncharacterized protein n=1 Tax=Dechloromonas hankyongensis TaxID=2908002 RepID=A0ABS9JY94_9RHOO|nr:hypothetical protein [Dechloromonas hankyongensis]MCG2575870.1 hypothetical protein [Dechloromonas hankyongensis]